jgi:hypothetical protein
MWLQGDQARDFFRQDLQDWGDEVRECGSVEVMKCGSAGVRECGSEGVKE